MTPVDWSWGEAYAAPTMVQTPFGAIHTFQPPQPQSFTASRQTAGHFGNISIQPTPPPVPAPSTQPSQQTSTSAFPFASVSTTTANNLPDAFRSRASSGARTPSSSVSSAGAFAPRPTAGRKRSADELSVDDLPRTAHAAGLAAVRKARGEPIIDPGMAPGDTDEAMDASCHTGTWAEELSERMRQSSVYDEANRGGHPARPVLVPRKSQRVIADAPDLDDVALAVAAEGTGRRQSVQVSVLRRSPYHRLLTRS